jgi:homoserine dehydrogenase
MKPINVGLLGIGTVGGGTWTVLTRNQEEITRRAGRPIQITAVADRDTERATSLTGGSVKVTGDAFEVVRDPSIDIVVELIGGYTVAKQLVLEASHIEEVLCFSASNTVSKLLSDDSYARASPS